MGSKLEWRDRSSIRCTADVECLRQGRTLRGWCKYPGRLVPMYRYIPWYWRLSSTPVESFEQACWRETCPDREYNGHAFLLGWERFRCVQKHRHDDEFHWLCRVEVAQQSSVLDYHRCIYGKESRWAIDDLKQCSPYPTIWPSRITS